MTKLIKLTVLIILSLNLLYAAVAYENYKPVSFSQKELKQLDQKIAERLNLTNEQIEKLKTNRDKNLKEMQTTINKMEDLRKKIYNVYIIGIPKYQADLRTATMKVELALLKQNADRIRYENRKNFESILTDKQKAEFEALKKELNTK